MNLVNNNSEIIALNKLVNLLMEQYEFRPMIYEIKLSIIMVNDLSVLCVLQNKLHHFIVVHEHFWYCINYNNFLFIYPGLCVSVQCPEYSPVSHPAVAQTTSTVLVAATENSSTD